MRKEWYNPDEADVIRVVRPAGRLPVSRRRGRPGSGIGACLVYPLVDGPGVGLLLFFPPVLWFLSLPVFDFIAIIDPFRKGNWALGLLVLPVFMPLLFSFVMTLGYILLFLGQMLVASAVGEDDHPRWPEWHPASISEGIGRWLWALVFGIVLGGFPIVVYWMNCGDLDWLDWFIIADLVILGAGYTQMALAAALLHDSLLAANPVTVVRSIARVGWDYVRPALAGGIALMLGAGIFWVVVFRMPSLSMAIIGLGVFWVFILYESMVVLRLLGLTYHAHAHELLWFHHRPKWGTPGRFGNIYTNS
jgi:hypothetical protein